MNNAMFPALGAALLLFATGCKNESTQSASTQASAAPTSSAIPDDFVVNGFFSNPSGKLAVNFDGGVDFGENMNAGNQGDSSKTKVLEPGAEPRVRLTYNLALNKTTTIVATIQSEVQGPDIPEGQGKQPPVKFTLAITPKKKLDPTKTQVELKITKFDMGQAPPEAQQQIAALQASLQKINGTVNISPDGQATDLALPGAETLPRGSGEQVIGLLDRALELLVVPLPAASIGPGGKWRVVSSAPEEGADIQSTFTLLAKNEQGYEIKVESTRIVAGRTLKDRSGKVVTLEVKGTSTYTLTTALDGPTIKATGESKTDVITQAQGESKHVNGEKTTVTIEKVEAPKK
jgi:hypothetical protein